MASKGSFHGPPPLALRRARAAVQVQPLLAGGGPGHGDGGEQGGQVGDAGQGGQALPGQGRGPAPAAGSGSGSGAGRGRARTA